MLSNFDFDLPQKLIAQEPLERGKSRLLYRSQHGKITDGNFSDILDLIQPGDLLVLNNTKVIPSCLYGDINGTKVKINLINKIVSSNSERWEFLSKPRKKVHFRSIIHFSDKLVGVVVEKFNQNNMDVIEFFGVSSTNLDLTQPQKHLYSSRVKSINAEVSSEEQSKIEKISLEFKNYKFEFINISQQYNLRFLSQQEFFTLLDEVGHMPLPPYMKREANQNDKESYQTVFSKFKGSVAAPTAGLHFTEELLEKIQSKGAKIAYITLHVGGGTFLPVRVDNISDHKMHHEFYTINQMTCDLINDTKLNNNRIIAVGTTVIRTLESAATFYSSSILSPHARYTDIFIKENFKFKIADCLITNFHLPKSTLFMLVCSFIGGINAGKELYNHAINGQYRFFSYGDACFLTK